MEQQRFTYYDDKANEILEVMFDSKNERINNFANLLYEAQNQHFKCVHKNRLSSFSTSIVNPICPMEVVIKQMYNGDTLDLFISKKDDSNRYNALSVLGNSLKLTISDNEKTIIVSANLKNLSDGTKSLTGVKEVNVSSVKKV